ncbi:MAG: hypothetical protein KI790_05195, partial [Cyclobacteriaceae bacterium]|nr:hypothetical protein [Cyclobacteriaceae bacterium HetDA_MAG_MS6]
MVGNGGAAISNDQFSISSIAVGTARTSHIFGIGGTKKDALVLEAKRNLYESNPLLPGQALGQTTLDFKVHFFWPVMISKVVMTAEVIDFSDERQYNSLEVLDRFVNPEEHRYFAPGDSVEFQGRYSRIVRGRVLKHDGNTLTVNYLDVDNIVKVKRMQITPELIKNNGVKVKSVENEKKPIRYSAPKDAKGKIVKFKLLGNIYQGEVLRVADDVYVIRTIDSSNREKEILVKKKNVIED